MKNRTVTTWVEWLFIRAGLLLSVIGLSAICLNLFGLGVRDSRSATSALPDLQPVDRIEAAAGKLRGFNVLIITSDTTRADHLHCYGNRNIGTPIIDSLARNGILCSRAISPSSSTLPAHSSLMTGLYPVHHGVRANGTFRLDDKYTTLAELLKSSGYRTGAAISAFVLDSRFGLSQGFDTYFDDLTKGMKYSAHMFRERAAELTNEPVIDWLRENHDEPFFLWVHYFDPHAVYLPPEPYRSQYRDNLYDGEIAYTDSQIGALLDELKGLGVYDKTLIIFTSDHGEGLGEHGEMTHSLLIYDSTLHVPMIISAPSQLPKGKVLQRQTCLIDVVPTVLGLLGEDIPDDLDGVDLCSPPPAEQRSLLVETISTMTLHGWAPLIGIRRDDFKYIYAPTPELYDLEADPGELNNLHEQQHEMVQELRSELVHWLGEDPYLATQNAVDLGQLDMGNDTLRQLSALGYVASTSGEVDDLAPLADPKDMIVQWESVQKAMHLQALGKPHEAIPLLEQCVAAADGDVFARSILAGCYRRRGDYDRALAHFKFLEERSPTDAIPRLGTAGIYLAMGKLDAAETKIVEAQKLGPQNAHAYILRGQISAQQRKQDEAIRHFNTALEMDPGTSGPTAHNQIGLIHLLSGNLEAARQAFNNAIQIDALNGVAHDGLANVLQLEGKPEEALAELRLALKYDPNQPRALATMASILSQRGEQKKALELCKRALDISPKFSIAHNNLGLTYRRNNQLDLAEKHYLEAIKNNAFMDIAHVNLAQLYNRQGKTEAALDQFRLAIKANPYYPSPIALGNLGVHHHKSGQYRRAMQLYRRALRRDPDYAVAHKHIASIYALEQFDRPDLAARHLRRSLELDSEQPDATEMRNMLARAEKEAVRRGSKKEPLLRGDHDNLAPDSTSPLQNDSPLNGGSNQ